MRKYFIKIVFDHITVWFVYIICVDIFLVISGMLFVEVDKIFVMDN